MVVGERLHPALALLAAQPKLLARQGSIVAHWSRRGDRRVGPYFELRYREAGQYRTVYLGREGPLVQQVRVALDHLQTPLRQFEAMRKAQKQVRAGLRFHKSLLDKELHKVGLRLQGYEVRGWRRSRLRG